MFALQWGKVRKIEEGPRSTCFYTWLRDIKIDPPGLVGGPESYSEGTREPHEVIPSGRYDDESRKCFRGA